MTVEILLFGLLIISTMTGLFTEAVKKLLAERGIAYRANSLAGVIAVVLAVLVSVAYVILAGLAITPQLIVCIIALIILSWLCAMVGYDKVIQTIAQFRNKD